MNAVIAVSASGIIIGLLLAILVFLVVTWLLGLVGAGRIAQPVAAILAVLVFLSEAFGW